MIISDYQSSRILHQGNKYPWRKRHNGRVEIAAVSLKDRRDMSLTTPSNTLNTFSQGAGIVKPIAHDLFESDDTPRYEKVVATLILSRSEEERLETPEIAG